MLLEVRGGLGRVVLEAHNVIIYTSYISRKIWRCEEQRINAAAFFDQRRSEFAKSLRLPTFEVDGMKLIKRITLIVRDGKIEKVFYPVFPPDKNAEEVVEWLTARRGD